MFAGTYQVAWELLPNWAGHLLASAGLLAGLPPKDRGSRLMTLTLAGFAASILWLRRRVTGNAGALAAGLAVFLALNVTWLLGFTSFLLGACLFPITLGVWWAGRENLRWRRVAGLVVLLVIGYFCHLVSLGLTVVGLGVLALLTPGTNWRTRLFRTAVACLSLVPLGVIYLRKSQQGGSCAGLESSSNPLATAWWAKQLGWIDPITLASKTVVPLTGGYSSRWFAILRRSSGSPWP